MRNKQRKLETTISVSELILSAVYFLQKKNGVTAKDITKYICTKRGFKQSQMKNKVKQALERGIRNGIFNMKRGLYKVDEECKKKLTNLKKKIKKKNETNKTSKKNIQKKAEESKTEEKKVTPMRETPKKSTEFMARRGSHSLSEDIFDRRGRENSYFEPSSLARASDEECDDFDDEDYDNEDESSESDEKENLDIFTITNGDEASQEKFPELNIYTAARQPRRKEVSEKGRETNKRSIRGRAKKRKMSKSQKKKRRESEKTKMKGVETDDDEDDDKQNQHNHDNEDYFDEDESQCTEDINNRESKNKTNESKTQSDLPMKSSDQKEIKDSKEVKEIKTNGKQKGKSAQGARKSKRTKRESSEENPLEDSEIKREKSLSNSNCLISSSTKLLHSDLKLSTSLNMTVSNVKFSRTSMKFEARNSSMLLISDEVKNEPPDQSVKDVELFKDFEILCECQSPKRQHLNRLHCCHSAKFAESNPNQWNMNGQRNDH